MQKESVEFMNFLTPLIHFFGQIWGDLVALFGGQVWLLLVVLTLTTTLIVDILVRWFIYRLHRHLVAKHFMMWDAFVSAATGPVSLAIWVTGVTWAVTTLMMRFQLWTETIPYIQNTKSTLLVLLVGWYAIRVAGRLEQELKKVEKKDSRFDAATVEALSKLIKLIAFIITVIIVLSAWGVDPTGLLAFGGMSGIVVGFAAKDLLGNVFGGLVLYIDKPFVVGDWIRSPDREIEGTVEKIGWRMTVVRTFDKRPLYIPNGIFSNIAIENPSRMTNRRIKEVIGVRYCDVRKMAQITADIRNMLQNHPDIDQNQVIIVNFLEFSESSLNFLLYTFTRTTDWVTYHHVKERILLEINQIIDSHQAEMAFPTRTLYIEDKVNLAISESQQASAASEFK
ncbi:mechanosensitive ion channel family protein [Galenea microaerophila]